MANKILCIVIHVLILAAELQLTSQHDDSSLPVTYSAIVLEGGEQVCPPEEQLEIARAEIGQDIRNTIRNHVLCPGQVQENPAVSCLEISQCINFQLPSEYYWITGSNGTAVQVYCDMDRDCSCSSASVGGWSRVAYLNMADPTHQCPPAWREITEPVRTCARTNQTLPHPGPLSFLDGGGCSSAHFGANGILYSHICGRVVGYQVGSPDGFGPYSRSYYTRLEDPFVDGVILTHGTKKQHIWTFSSLLTEGPILSWLDAICPCTNPVSTQSVPPFIGTDYFCETAITGDHTLGLLHPSDPLWDGENCGSQSTCCEFNDPPYFCKSLSEPTTDDIEVRICADEGLDNEDTPIELIEIFVQ